MFDTSQVTAVILNYWENRRKWLPEIVRPYKKVIVWNNDSTVTIPGAINSSKNYGSWSRYIAGLCADTEWVIFQDNDLILDECNIEKLYLFCKEHDNCIAGYYGRQLIRSQHPYIQAKILENIQEAVEGDIVVGRLSMMRRDFIPKVLEFGANIENIGSCDDIVASFANKKHGNKNYIVPLTIAEIPTEGQGLCNQPDHYVNRDEMCKKLLGVDKKIKVRVGIPSLNNFNYSADAGKLIELVKWNRFEDINFELSEIGNRYCDLYARNKCIYANLDFPDTGNDNYGNWYPSWVPGYDYFIMMDDDTGFTVDSIRRMIEVARRYNDRCVVSGAYLNRWSREKMVFGMTLDDCEDHCMSREDYHKIKEFPVKITWCGNGMMLIPKKVLMLLPQPIYRHHNRVDHEGKNGWYHSDQSFAMACHNMDIPIYLSSEKGTHRGYEV